MDQPTNEPVGTPLQWLAAGVSPTEFADRVRRSFSLGDRIEGRRVTELRLTLRGAEAARVMACDAHLFGTRVSVQGVELGTVRQRVVAPEAGELYVWVEFDPGVTPEQLAGKTVRLPLFEVVEREALTVMLGPSPGGEPRS